jgi:hypothetical protein
MAVLKQLRGLPDAVVARASRVGLCQQQVAGCPEMGQGPPSGNQRLFGRRARVREMAQRQDRQWLSPADRSRVGICGARDRDDEIFRGNDIGKGNANCEGCGGQWDIKQTAPAGSF